MQLPFTKGQMIKELKNAGVRQAEKDGSGAVVSLEHLKYFQIAKIWDETFHPQEA